MRRFLVVLIACFGLWVAFDPPESAVAMEAILGIVESVRSETGEVVLRVVAPGGAAGTGDLVVLRFGEDLAEDAETLGPGDTVRVWGNFASGGPSVFDVHAFRGGPPGRSGGDPTGVRSRLGRRPFSGRGSGSRGGGRR